MGKKDGITPSKITIKIWKPVIEKLDTRMNEACLRRDLYLARLLDSEVRHLDSEVALANSQAAYDHVVEQLERLDRKPMSLALPPDLVERINDVCRRKRIVRDTFFNRLFLLLAATPKALDAILFPHYDGDWKLDVWREYRDDPETVKMSILPLASVTDPFWAIREAFEIDRQGIDLHDWTDPQSGKKIKMMSMPPDHYMLPENVYTKYLSTKIGDNELTGLNCHVPDWLVPEHPANRQRNNALDAIFEEL